MEKIEQIRLLKELMRHRDNDTNVDVGGPVLAVRDDDGKFRAFANTCRHSGVVLEDRDRNAMTSSGATNPRCITITTRIAKRSEWSPWS